VKIATHVAYGNANLKCPACTGQDAKGVREMEGCDIHQTFGVPTLDSNGDLLGPFKGRFPRLSITCTICAGRDAECPVCKGGGEERVFQCPGTVTDVESAAVIRAYRDYKNGILPDEGGMYDQSAIFVDMIQTVDAEIAALQVEERKHSRSAKGSKKPTRH